MCALCDIRALQARLRVAVQTLREGSPDKPDNAACARLLAEAHDQMHYDREIVALALAVLENRVAVVAKPINHGGEDDTFH